MNRFIHILGTLLTLLLTVTAGMQAGEINLPARFTRITSASQLKAGGFYVIGGEGIVSGNGGQFALLSNKRKGSSTLKGIVFANEETLTVSNLAVVWQFVAETEAGKYTIVSAENGSFLNTPKAGSTTLEASSKSKTLWSVTASAQGFHLQSNRETERYLGMNGGEEPYFGNYTKNGADCHELQIYRMESNALSEQEGSAGIPADGTTIALYANRYLCDAEGNALSSDGYITGKEEVAPDAEVPLWTVKHEGDGVFFTLKNTAGQYLGHSLQPVAGHTRWAVKRGHIVTDEATPRYLCFLNGFGTRPAEQTHNAADVRMLPVGQAPERRIEDGVATLTGTWSARQLQAMSWDGIAATDAAGISLPRPLLPLDGRPQPTNSILYVAEADGDIIPRDWKFVVACEAGGTSCHLIRNAELYDRQPLTIDREIDYAAQQVSYRRTAPADELWNTLCIPFTAKVPTGYRAEKLESADNHELVFGKTEVIEADFPVIIRATGKAVGDLTLTAHADGTLLPTNYENTPVALRGTYQAINVGTSTYGLYFLNTDGTQFVRAAAGSHLAPFRAYLQFTTSGKAYDIRHRESTTGIATPSAGNNAATIYYTLDGRRAANIRHEHPVKSFPRGIHIVEGRKIIVSP